MFSSVSISVITERDFNNQYEDKKWEQWFAPLPQRYKKILKRILFHLMHSPILIINLFRREVYNEKPNHYTGYPSHSDYRQNKYP